MSTHGSTIDTEMGLYGPEGKLLTESDDTNEIRQSVITAAILREATHYIAVGQYDTIFGRGSFVGPLTAAANFILNYGANQSIQGVLPVDGVR